MSDEPKTYRSGESFTMTWTQTVRAHEDDMITDSDGITWVYRGGQWVDVRHVTQHTR